jgi:hypothetical protein
MVVVVVVVVAVGWGLWLAVGGSGVKSFPELQAPFSRHTSIP